MCTALLKQAQCTFNGLKVLSFAVKDARLRLQEGGKKK